MLFCWQFWCLAAFAVVGFVSLSLGVRRFGSIVFVHADWPTAVSRPSTDFRCAIILTGKFLCGCSVFTTNHWRKGQTQDILCSGYMMGLAT